MLVLLNCCTWICFCKNLDKQKNIQMEIKVLTWTFWKNKYGITGFSDNYRCLQYFIFIYSGYLKNSQLDFAHLKYHRLNEWICIIQMHLRNWKLCTKVCVYKIKFLQTIV